MRVTEGMISRQILRNLNKTSGSILHSQQQLSSGQRLTKASDDPVGVVEMMSYRNDIAHLEEYKKTMAGSTEWMKASSTVLASIEDALFEVRDIAEQADSGLVTAEQHEALAQQVDQYLQELIDLSNSRNGERALFGGTQTRTQPFTAVYTGDRITAVTANPDGIDGEQVREIGQGQSIVINAKGGELFQPGGTGTDSDVFQVLINIRDALAAHDISTVGTEISALNDIQNRFTEANSTMGSKITRLQFSVDRANIMVLDKTERLSDIQDTDYAQAIIDYYAQQQMYDTSLSISAQILQNSLVNYL
jgi:flagellar hook-associated protein 3 FlgL